MTNLFTEGLCRTTRNIVPDCMWSQQILAPAEVDALYIAFKDRLIDESKAGGLQYGERK